MLVLMLRHPGNPRRLACTKFMYMLLVVTTTRQRARRQAFAKPNQWLAHVLAYMYTSLTHRPVSQENHPAPWCTTPFLRGRNAPLAERLPVCSCSEIGAQNRITPSIMPLGFRDGPDPTQHSRTNFTRSALLFACHKLSITPTWQIDEYA